MESTASGATAFEVNDPNPSFFQLILLPFPSAYQLREAFIYKKKNIGNIFGNKVPNMNLIVGIKCLFIKYM